LSNLETALQNTRHVIVNVDAAGQMDCVPSELTVTGSDVLIAFHLNGMDWAFPAAAAVVVSDPEGQFPFPSWTLNDKLATLLDRNTAKASFSYTVTVRNIRTGHQQRLDPTIKNEK
jgi:hypothetical protein